MRSFMKRILSGIGAILHFIGGNVWLLVIFGPPVVLLTGRYELLMFLLLLIVFWELTRRVTGMVIRRGAVETWQMPEQHLTYTGYIYLLLALALCAISLNSGLNLLYLMTCLLPSLLVASMVVSSFVMSRLKGRWDLPGYIFAGQQFQADLLLKNRKRWIGSPGVTVETDPAGGNGELASAPAGYVPPGQTRLLKFGHTFPERGPDSLPALRGSTTFPFGLMQASATLAEKREVLVFPALGRINSDKLNPRGGAGDEEEQKLARKAPMGDFRSLRKYREGDSFSHIHWRTSARMGELYVKEFERPDRQHFLLLLDTYLPPTSSAEREERQRDRFEKAVSFVATLAEMFLKRGTFYAFASYCPHLVRLPWGAGPAHFYQLLELLARVQSSDTDSLRALAGAMGPRYLDRGVVYVVSLGSDPASASSRGLGLPADRMVLIDANSDEFDEVFTLDR